MAITRFLDPDYPPRPHPGRPWPAAAPGGKSGRDNGDSGPVANTAGPPLHAEQRYEFVRRVRVDDVLNATQRPRRTWEKTRRSGGQLLFSETVTEFRDSDDQLVVTATAVAVRVQPADNRAEVAQ